MIDLHVSDGKVTPGSCYLRDTEALAHHDGSQPDLFLSWTAIDVAARSVDVVLYFHGFAISGKRQALLSDFVEVSGLDLMKGGKSLADRQTPRGGTAPISEAVQAAAANVIAGSPASKQAGLRKCLVVEKAKGEHMDVPRRYSRGLLSTGAAAANV